MHIDGGFRHLFFETGAGTRAEHDDGGASYWGSIRG